MDRPRPVRMSLVALLRWLVAAGLAVGLAGAWPTWHAAGWDGLWGLLLAGGIVLAATAFSASLVAYSAIDGPQKAALTFVEAGLARVTVSLALAAAAAWWYRPSAASILTWLAVFYAAMLPMECAWLIRALRRHSCGRPECGNRVR
jgi:hypothetical protein